MKPLFSDKINSSHKITLINENKIISGNSDIAQIFNDFFSTAASKLNIEISDDHIMDVQYIKDRILKAIKKYEKHPSIIKINESIEIKEKFEFTSVTCNDVENVVNRLGISKATTNRNISTKIFRQNVDICSGIITNIYNNCNIVPDFPSNLKYADVNPIHKKEDSTDKRNYRPVSILPVVSKVFERLMDKDITLYINKYLSDRLCGFRKGFSTQLSLMIMLEEIKKNLDKGKVSGMLLTDLSKAFDCIVHDLLVAKLHAYCFDYTALALVNSYLSGRKQRTKIAISFSYWTEIILGVPQGSILGPLFLNIYINDIFLATEVTDIVNFADDNTPFACDTTTDLVITRLERDIYNLCKWFKLNYLKSNEDKCHLLMSNPSGDLSIKVGNEIISNSHEVKLLGITINNSLNFDTHVAKLCKKANQKLHALARLSNYMDQEKLRVIMKAFVTSQFSYCPLIWMFHSRRLNIRINRIHEKTLDVL